MSLLTCGSVRNDSVILRQCFSARRLVQDQQGVLVGCTVGLYGDGIRPTAASSRVTYDRTQSWLINHNKMTIRMRLKMSANPGAVFAALATKWPSTNLDNQLFAALLSGVYPGLYIANAANDASNYFRLTNALAASQEAVIHLVYDGSLAAGSRGIVYANGAATGTTIVGTIPTSMRASASPLVLFQRGGGATEAPPTDFTLYDFCLWNKALSAADVLLDARDSTYSGVL